MNNYVLTRKEFERVKQDEQSLYFLRDKLSIINDILRETKDFNFKEFSEKLQNRLDKLDKIKS